MKVRLKYKQFSVDTDRTNRIVNNYYKRLESLMSQGGLEADPAAYKEVQALREVLLKKGLIHEGSVEEDFKNLSSGGGGKSGKRMTTSGSKNFDEFLDFMNEGKDNLSNGKIKDSSNWFKKKWYYGFGKNEEELKNLLLNEYLIDTSKDVDSTTKSISNILGFSKGKRGREFNNWILKNTGKETLDLKDIGGLNAINRLGSNQTVLDQVINNDEFFNNLSPETQEKFLDYSRKRSRLLKNRNIGRIGMAATAIGAGTGLLYGGYKAATKSRFLNNKTDTPQQAKINKTKTTKAFSETDKKLVGPIRRAIINNAVDSAIKEKKDDSNVKKQGHLAATLGGLGIGALNFAGAKLGSNWLADRIVADGYQTANMAKDEGEVHSYMGNMEPFADEKQKFKDKARKFKKQSWIDIFHTNKKITDEERELIRDIADNRHKRITKAGTILGTSLLALSTLGSNMEAHKILSRKLKARNRRLKKNNKEDEDIED